MISEKMHRCHLIIQEPILSKAKELADRLHTSTTSYISWSLALRAVIDFERRQAIEHDIFAGISIRQTQIDQHNLAELYPQGEDSRFHLVIPEHLYQSAHFESMKRNETFVTYVRDSIMLANELVSKTVETNPQGKTVVAVNIMVGGRFLDVIAP